jgi:formin-binding protein 4
MTKPSNLKTEVAEHKAPDEADQITPSNGKALKYEVCAGITIDANEEIDKSASTTAQNSQARDIEAVPPNVESDKDEDMDVEIDNPATCQVEIAI